MLAAAYHPDKIFDWGLENVTATAFLILVFSTYRKFVFSDLSYLLMLVYLGIHEWGAHYKYSDVPLGEWLKPILHTARNDYDRVAHFAFGFLLAYPMREIAMRALRTSGNWLYYLPVECTLGLSAVYEILEALAASVLTPERGEEFVGMQGDMWDSQEDMFMAGLGAFVAVLIIGAVVKLGRTRKVDREIAITAGAAK